MALARLPAEVIRRIIQGIADGHNFSEDLQACALACRTLSSPCRSHLFRELSLGSDNRCTELSSMLDRDPIIVPYIKSVKASCNGVSFPADSNALFAALQKCTNVASLDLMFDEDITGAQDLEEWNLSLPSLHTLEISGGPVPCSVVEALLSTCSSLASLNLTSVGFTCDGRRPQRRKTPVRRLYIESCAGSDPNAGMRLAESTAGLQEIKVAFNYEGDAEFAGEVIRAIGGDLRQLQMSMQWDLASEAHSILSRHFDVSACTGLRALRLTWIDAPLEDEEEWIGPLLDRIGSCVLEEVTLDFVTEGTASGWHGEAFNWPLVERALSQERQPQLRQLAVSFIEAGEHGAAWLDQICQKLPDLKARGIIHVVDFD